MIWKVTIMVYLKYYFRICTDRKERMEEGRKEVKREK
jgi:hypothetical protein